ncbi:MAG: hypothetical protein KC645_04300 [Gemmatimonadetes bacterium]|nr:hypothetical protein [Gemmatimonadota bacterium]
MRIAIVRSGWGLALALLLAQGCAQPGKSKTTAELGITSPQFRVTHETDTTGTTLDVDGGSAGADFCFELDWIGSDGAVLSSSYVTTGGTGHFAAQVPVGTVRMEGIYYKCPDLDGGGESDEGGGEGDGEGDGRAISPPRCLQPQTQGTRQGRETDRAMSVEIREYGLISMPLGLTSGRGGQLCSYRVSVHATSPEHAKALALPITSQGVGAAASEAVRVQEYTRIELLASGLRVRCATPDLYKTFHMDCNEGAFQADLATGANLVRYQELGWDVIEVMIPESLLELGTLPGVAYQNTIESSYTTSTLPAPAAFDYTYTYWN